MKTYKVSFNGRLNGAIGIIYLIHTEITASKNATKEEICLLLYNKYEHISNLTIHN